MLVRHLATALFIAVILAAPGNAQVEVTPPAGTMAAFAERLQGYVDLRARVAGQHPELSVLSDYGEIQRRTNILAAAIIEARPAARQGDIFTPDVAITIRRLVRYSCNRDYAQLLMLTHEDRAGPLPPAVVHGRWPGGVPVPTMMPDLLADLPRLPAGLEYRFVRGDLILLDIEANLIVDLIPDVIPLT